MRTGDYFFHTKWLDVTFPMSARIPAICKVTRVDSGGFYYKIVYLINGRESLGGSTYIRNAERARFVRGWRG